jgi:hypothetical protein
VRPRLDQLHNELLRPNVHQIKTQRSDFNGSRSNYIRSISINGSNQSSQPTAFSPISLPHAAAPPRTMADVHRRPVNSQPPDNYLTRNGPTPRGDPGERIGDNYTSDYGDSRAAHGARRRNVPPRDLLPPTSNPERQHHRLCPMRSPTTPSAPRRRPQIQNRVPDTGGPGFPHRRRFSSPDVAIAPSVFLGFGDVGTLAQMMEVRYVWWERFSYTPKGRARPEAGQRIPARSHQTALLPRAC